MADHGAEKRKVAETTVDSVEVPFAEVKDLAEKVGENAASTVYIYVVNPHTANAVMRTHVPASSEQHG